MARESYDVALMQLRDWTTVYTMSSPEVASGYTTLHARNNLSSPFNTYGKERAIRVKILSIVLIGGGDGTAPKGATVRFQRSLFEKKTGVTRPLDSKIATMAFSYKSNLKMDENDRIENPLGFQVTSYRVDGDYAASPPAETQLPQAPTLPDSGVQLDPGGPVFDGAGPSPQVPDGLGPAARGADEAVTGPASPPVSTTSADGVSNR